MEGSYPHSFEQTIPGKTIACGSVCVTHPAAKTVVFKVMVPLGRDTRAGKTQERGFWGSGNALLLELDARCRRIPSMKLNSTTYTLIICACYIKK